MSTSSIIDSFEASPPNESYQSSVGVEKSSGKDGRDSGFCEEQLSINQSAEQSISQDCNITQTESPRIEPINGIVQPPIIPPVGKSTRHTNQLEFLEKEVLRPLLDAECSEEFREPVNILDPRWKGRIYDYYEVIREPMDLKTIKSRLENVYYSNADECKQDFQQIFQNCRTYNEGKLGTRWIIRSVDALEKLFTEKMKGFPNEDLAWNQKFCYLKREVTNDEDLNELWRDCRDDARPIYPTDFPGLEILSTYCRSTLKSLKNRDSLWTEIYRPRSSKEFVGNRCVVEKLMNWMTKWKKRLQRQEKSSQEDDEKSIDDGAVECLLSNVAFIGGPTGMGKTCLVYAIAEELGFKVIELNSSSLKDQEQILTMVEQATQTHRMNINLLLNEKKSQKSNTASSVSVANGTAAAPAPEPITSNKRGRKKTRPPPVVESGVTKVVPMFVILFDDVDVIFEADDRFWHGLQRISETALVPIVLTCKDYDVSKLTVNDLLVKSYQLTSIDMQLAAYYFRLLLLSRGIRIQNAGALEHFCKECKSVEACLEGLQIHFGKL